MEPLLLLLKYYLCRPFSVRTDDNCSQSATLLQRSKRGGNRGGTGWGSLLAGRGEGNFSRGEAERGVRIPFFLVFGFSFVNRNALKRRNEAGRGELFSGGMENKKLRQGGEWKIRPVSTSALLSYLNL